MQLASICVLRMHVGGTIKTVMLSKEAGALTATSL